MKRAAVLPQNVTTILPLVNSSKTISSKAPPFKNNTEKVKPPPKYTVREPLRDACPNNDPAECQLVFDEGYMSFAQEVRC